MASESKKFLLFKTLIAVGFALSIVLLIQTVSTYKYVAGELMMQEAERDTQRKINTLVGAVRTAQTQDMEVIGGILQEFLEDVTLDSDREDEEEKAGDAVTLITMHSCKGLEFPHVYIVGLEDGLLPHSRSKVEGTLDEERRLFYVGVTRAMQTLTISHCGGRKKYGQIMPCHPSPFLKELPPELVETDDEKSKKPVESTTGKNLFAAMRDAAQ